MDTDLMLFLLEKKLFLFFFILLLPFYVYSEQVGIFKSDLPLNSNDTIEIVVPAGVIGLSDNIPISGDSTESVENPTSLFFIVDHSNSMDLPKRDPKLNRMKLVSSIVDTLAAYPNKYPNIECGLALFAKNLYHAQSNDPLLEKLPGDSTNGMFLPLVELNKSYSESNNKTGQEIISNLVKTAIDSTIKIPKAGSSGEWFISDTTNHYQYDLYGFGLEWYHDSTIDFIDTIYKFLPTPQTDWGSGKTKIDYGFYAAVEALKRSKNFPENRFIIFLSDGTGQDEDYKDGFMNGKSDPIPTTFTIYFTADGTAPDLLLNMNDSIRNNGYSSSNLLHTNLKAYENTTADALVNYVMDSIVKIFESGSIIEPNKITIDGDSSVSWNSATNIFTFPHPLALTGYETYIDMNLDFGIMKDSIITNDSIISVIVDTFFNIHSTTIIDTTLSKDMATGIIEWWDRDIMIRSGMLEINNITDLNKTLSVIFSSDPMESGYKYSRAEITVKCVNSGDSIKLNCQSITDTLFTESVYIDPIGPVNYTDEYLSPDSVDEIIFTFRNTEDYSFPLDTLEKRISYTLTTEFDITNGALFDDNSDGLCDRIRFEISGDNNKIAEGANEIAEKVVLPFSRNLSIINVNALDGFLDILVKSAEGINTSKNSDDSASVLNDIHISTGGILKAFQIELIDSMAPVCVSATLRKKTVLSNDTLIVVLSETLDQISQNQPFVVVSMNGYSFMPQLNDYSSFTEIHNFAISKNASDSIIIGDSLYISTLASVADTSGIVQYDSLNKRVPINIDLNGVDILTKKVIFYDPHGKGFPSEIKFCFSIPVEESIRGFIEPIIIKVIEELPRYDMAIDSLSWKDSSIVLYTTEEGNNFYTDVTEDDKIILNSGITLSDLYDLGKVDINPIDSMAPVIIEATIYDNSLFYKDSIVVVYSEESKYSIEINPYVFYKSDGADYYLDLSLKYTSGDIHSFSVESADNVKDTDSINIFAGNIISDLNMVYQKGQKNKKVPIKVIRPKVNVSISSITFYDPDGNGYPGKVNVILSKLLTTSLKSSFEVSFKSYLEKIDDRNINIDSCYWDDSTAIFITSQHEENTGVFINTEINEIDYFILNDTLELSNTVVVTSQIIIPVDSMAPVLVSALCIDSLDSDSICMLVMNFSEDIKRIENFKNDKPYLFKSINNIFPVDLNLSLQNSRTLITVPFSTWDSNFWDEIDSVRIHPSFGISDGNIAQRANENRLVLLSHKKIAPTLKLKLNTTLITPDENYSYIVISPENDLSLDNVDYIEGRITIIDLVGNIVIGNEELKYDSSIKKIIYKWNGANSAGRLVGSGMYPVIISIDSIEYSYKSDDLSNSTIVKGGILNGAVGIKR